MAGLKIMSSTTALLNLIPSSMFHTSSFQTGIQVKALLDLNLSQFTQDGGLERYNQQPPGTEACIAS